MPRTYGDLGATYGSHTGRTYGTLFDADAQEAAPTLGLVTLIARVTTSDVAARVTITNVAARVTSSPIDYRIN